MRGIAVFSHIYVCSEYNTYDYKVKNTITDKAPPQRGINQIPFMSRAQGHRIISGGLALHYIG